MTSTLGSVKANTYLNKFLIEFKSKIGTIKISPNYILDLEIHYNATSKIRGYFLLNDHFDIINTGLDKLGMKFTMTIIDGHRDKFVRDFIVILSEEEKTQGFKTVRIVFQDEPSWNLERLYISKSYKESKISDIFKEFVSDIKDIKLNTIDTTPRQNFVIPQDRPLLNFIIDELDKEGIFFYQTKTEFIIGSPKVPETPDLPFMQHDGQELYGFNIIEYNLAFNDFTSTSKIPRMNEQVFSKDTKSMINYDKTFDDVKDSMKITDVIRKQDLTLGTKLKTKEYLIDTSRYEYLLQKNNTVLTLYVPGNIKYNELFKIVDVRLIGNQTTDETRNSGDVKLSGKYEIFEITDKIIKGQKFIQKLILKRIGENTKPESRIK